MTDNESSVDADQQIAAAERRLAEALEDLERARTVLGQRERELLDLLARLGRLPGDGDTSRSDHSRGD